MKITPISKELCEELETLAQEYPSLVFGNQGYEYLPRDIQDIRCKEIGRIEEILRGCITGFSKFFNFKRRKCGELVLRFDYDWGADQDTTRFIGVGYLAVRQLQESTRPLSSSTSL